MVKVMKIFPENIAVLENLMGKDGIFHTKAKILLG
jgi:hypothetical protein